MFLGIEIGATKLQLGAGRGDGTPLVELCRCDVELAAVAAGIRRQIETIVQKKGDITDFRRSAAQQRDRSHDGPSKISDVPFSGAPFQARFRRDLWRRCAGRPAALERQDGGRGGAQKRG